MVIFLAPMSRAAAERARDASVVPLGHLFWPTNIRDSLIHPASLVRWFFETIWWDWNPAGCFFCFNVAFPPSDYVLSRLKIFCSRWTCNAFFLQRTVPSLFFNQLTPPSIPRIPHQQSQDSLLHDLPPSPTRRVPIPPPPYLTLLLPSSFPPPTFFGVSSSPGKSLRKNSVLLHSLSKQKTIKRGDHSILFSGNANIEAEPFPVGHFRVPDSPLNKPRWPLQRSFPQTVLGLL